MKPFDARALVVVEPREGYDRDYYAIAPADLFGASIAHLRAALKEGKPPRRMIEMQGEEVSNPLRDLYDLAARVPAEAWDAALKPAWERCPACEGTDDACDTCNGLGRVVVIDKATRATRRDALNVARLFFKESLHQQLAYAPLGLHITKDERFRE